MRLYGNLSIVPFEIDAMLSLVVQLLKVAVIIFFFNMNLVQNLIKLKNVIPINLVLHRSDSI